jgi:uridine kinase
MLRCDFGRCAENMQVYTGGMLGDRIDPKPYQTGAAGDLVRVLSGRVQNRPVISIAGESGAGKTEIASELVRLFKNRDVPMVMFQQDDYFYRPPRTNQETRRKNVDHVGPGEVALKLLDSHLAHFKNDPETPLEKPLVVYYENRITSETIDPVAFEAVVVEGTYTSLLSNVDWRIFIDRNYKDTLKDRKQRGREPVDEFSERVLELEHKIISQHKVLAHILVNGDFSVTLVHGAKDN